MRRSTVLSLPLQLVFPGGRLKEVNEVHLLILEEDKNEVRTSKFKVENVPNI